MDPVALQYIVPLGAMNPWGHTLPTLLVVQMLNADRLRIEALHDTLGHTATFTEHAQIYLR